MPSNNQVDERTRKALEGFLFGREPKDVGIAPQGLDRDKVLAYLQERLEKPIEPTPVWRVRLVADAYELRELVPAFDKLLGTAPEKPDEYSKGIALVTAKAEVGDAKQRTEANDYYENTLVMHREACRYFPKLIVLYAALGPESSSQSLRKSIERELKRLEPRIEKDYESRIRYLELEALQNNDVPEAEESHKTKGNLLKLRDVRQRVRSLAEIYLGVENGGPYLDSWSVRHLRRAAREAGLPAMAEEIREVLNRIDIKALDELEKEVVRRRALRAIDYFDGPLDPKERRFVEKTKTKPEAIDELAKP